MQRAPLVLPLLAAALCAVVLLAGTPVAGAMAPGHAVATSSHGLATDAASVPVGADARLMAPGQVLHLTVTLRPEDPTGLATFLGAVDDPSSPEYRDFLTPEEFDTRFAPTPATEAALESYFAAFGGTAFVTTPDGYGVSFSIPGSGASAALDVGFESYSVGGLVGYTVVGPPRLPGDLRGQVAAIDGLSGASGPHLAANFLTGSSPRAVGPTPDGWVTDGAGLNEPWFLGSDYTSALHVSDLFPPSTDVANPTFPNRSAVATLLMSGYNSSTDTNLPPFDPVVVQAYYNDTFPASWPQPNVSGVPVNFSDLTPPLPGYFNGSNDSTANSVENSLDLEMAGSLAPGATIVNFYFAGSLFASAKATASLATIADGFGTCLAEALAHNYSGAHLAAVSGSFGLTDLNDTLWNMELEEAAATGVTVVAASGDQGNAPTELTGRFQGQWPTWPASAAFDTFGTVSVGGTSVTLNGIPTQIVSSNYTLNATYDATVNGIVHSSAWYDLLGGFGNVSGSEGGISVVYPEPSWQYDSAAQPAIVNATVEQGLGSLDRAEPDVAFPANTTVAYVSRNASGIYYEVVEGTSIAAPLIAGMLASWTAVAGHRFGFLDPELYRIASFFANESALPGGPPSNVTASPIEDVSTGSNYWFSAAPGWDATTGWGEIDGLLFLAADANSSIANYVYRGPTPGLPPPFALGPGTPDQYLFLFIGIAVATVAVVALSIGTRRPTPPGAGPHAPGTSTADRTLPNPPAGNLPPTAPGSRPEVVAPAPMTFLCPYCGAPRPAEPTRCPSCGLL